MIDTGKKVKKFLILQPLLLFIFLVAGCDSVFTQNLPKIDIHVNDVAARVEVAATPEHRSRGLMYRRSMPYDEGMLFVFPDAAIRSFWMKNTFIPLDIGYFDADGFLIEVHQMEPDDGAKSYVSSAPALYALEMNQGWFEDNDLRRFAELKLPHPLTAE